LEEKKMRKFLLAMVMVVVSTVPSFAAVQNVKVSGNIDSSYVARHNFDLGFGLTGTDTYDQSFAMTQTLLQIDADLSDNVQTVVRLINERAWGQDTGNSTGTPAGSDDIDINLAYVRMKELLYSPLTVEIGRMQLNYGNAFIIGANGANNVGAGNIAGFAADLTKATALDAVKAIFDYKPLTIDIFAAKAASNTLTGSTGAFEDDINLYGVNANYQLGDDMNTVIEGYFFARINESTSSGLAGAPAASVDTDKLYVPGLRASTNPISGLNVQGEVAWQRGTKALSAGSALINADRNAFGAQAIVNYQVKQEDVEKYRPVVQGVYTFVSGDSNPLDTTGATTPGSQTEWTAWDPMFEDQAGGKIYNALFSLTNAHILELSAAVSPMEDVTAKLSWTGIHLDKSLDRQTTLGPTVGNGSRAVIILPDGTTAPTSRITSNLDLGYEVDADLTYNYTEDVVFGVSLGVFNGGDAFEGDTTAKQAIAHVGVNF
jgi:hypothetical protein